VHPTNLHQLQDAILSIWANISKECFQRLVESMPNRIKAVLKAKGLIRYLNPVVLKHFVPFSQMNPFTSSKIIFHKLLKTPALWMQ